MYYDDKNKIIVEALPKNSIGPDGNFYFNFDGANDINLWADHNYYTIRNDSQSPGPDYHEDENKRVVILDKPYADISRVWILDNEIPVNDSPVNNITVPNNPTEE
jgi:hypothetical protein